MGLGRKVVPFYEESLGDARVALSTFVFCPGREGLKPSLIFTSATMPEDSWWPQSQPRPAVELAVDTVRASFGQFEPELVTYR